MKGSFAKNENNTNDLEMTLNMTFNVKSSDGISSKFNAYVIRNPSMGVGNL